ncbi:MAG TPA: outer membrane beta-barrel protein [Stellaceae bacterium]|nr:outer membrane beta-barrel protein [Stellaceae bacterium]
MRPVAALVAAALGCSTAPVDAGWYIGGEAGWTDLSDQRAKATIPVIGPRNDRETWAGGYNLGIRGGYAWGPWRVEEEFRYQSNDARKFSGAGATGSAAAYAVMTNILYDLPLHCRSRRTLGRGSARSH